MQDAMANTRSGVTQRRECPMKHACTLIRMDGTLATVTGRGRLYVNSVSATYF